MSKIDEMTIGEAKALAAMFGHGVAVGRPCPFEVGKAYLIRTVTHYWLGRVERVVGDFLVLSDAAWIADTGRYHKADCPENLVEAEPVRNGNAYVGMGAIVDARDWAAELVRDAK